VFEERYRRLVQDLADAPEERRRFGVVAIREGREVGADGIRALHSVGCVARLREVESYPDGSYDIVCSGAERFRLGDLDTSGPYLQAVVGWLGEPEGAAAPLLARSVGELFNVYRAALTGDDLDSQLPDDPRVLSYLVSAAAILDLKDKQALLEAPDTTSRLRLELAVLRREVALLGLLPSLPAVDLPRTPASAN
jgi:Lon protease-like protein